MASVKDGIQWRTTTTVHKFKDPDDVVANFVRNGGTIEQAKERWPERFMGIRAKCRECRAEHRNPTHARYDNRYRYVLAEMV